MTGIVLVYFLLSFLGTHLLIYKQIQRMSFDDQIDYFENTTKVIKKKIGERAGNNLLNEAIYFIGMGKKRSMNMKFI